MPYASSLADTGLHASLMTWSTVAAAIATAFAAFAAFLQWETANLQQKSSLYERRLHVYYLTQQLLYSIANNQSFEAAFNDWVVAQRDAEWLFPDPLNEYLGEIYRAVVLLRGAEARLAEVLDRLEGSNDIVFRRQFTDGPIAEVGLHRTRLIELHGRIMSQFRPHLTLYSRWRARVSQLHQQFQRDRGVEGS